MTVTPQPAESPSLVDLDATFLPIAQMRQIARVTELEGPCIVAEVDLGPQHWVYAQHFPGDPIFPGTLMIEAAGQVVALWAWANGHRWHRRSRVGRDRCVRGRDGS
jgi:3-hydroxymyristoyl/3-hydroxydecanoyl-(acyl carrier protein) dehydratase